jgi:Leucine-rich repeat (LRR) protein
MSRGALWALLEAPALGALTSLDLGELGLTPDEMARVARAPCLASLRELELGKNHVGDRGASALAASPHLKHLRALYMVSASVRADGVAALAEAEALRGLRVLNLRNNTLGEDGCAPLARLGALEELYLGQTGVGDAGVAALCGLRRLQILVLDRCGVGAKGAIALIEPDSLPALRELDLSGNSLGDEGQIALAAAPRIAQLDSLKLDYSDGGADGARALASSPYLSLSQRAAWGAAAPAAESIMDLPFLIEQLDALLVMNLDPEGDMYEEWLESRWADILHQLSCWGAADLEQIAIPRVEAATAGWPQRCKYLREEQLVALVSGERAPAARLCRALTLMYWQDAELLEALLAAPELENIRYVSVHDDLPEQVSLLLSSPIAPNIIELRCYDQGGEATTLIARCTSLTSLRRLTLQDTGFPSEAAALAAAPFLANLDELNMWGRNGAPTAMLEALIASPHLPAKLRAELTMRRDRHLLWADRDDDDLPPF